MPCGRFVNGGFEITVTADYDANNNDLYTEWLRALQKAAELFYHATDGQLRITRWLIANRSYGLSAAEVVLHDAGETSYATAGGFGQPALLGLLQQTHLMPYAKYNPMTITHELAHQIFALKDEYTGEVETDPITFPLDPGTGQPAVPDDPATGNPIDLTTQIPIDNPARANNALDGFYAILLRGTVLERRVIVASTATLVTVHPDDPFSAPIGPGSPVTVSYQDPAATCHEPPPDANEDGYLCLMQTSQNAGNYNLAGAWQPYTGNAPGMDFCSADNHDPDHDTAHDAEYGKSCWEVIGDTMQQRFNHPLDLPNPPALAPSPGWSPGLLPEVTLLVEERRIVLAVDRSGSMAQGDKMASARRAANYWVDRLRVEAALGGLDARLALISYNQAATPAFGLADGNNLPSSVDQDIDGLQPSGWTNIRAALATARGLLVPNPDDRAATQAVVLLTDGVHNYPDGSTALDELPLLQNDGVRVFPVAFGAPDGVVDTETLEALGRGTCGGYPFQANNPETAEVLTEQIYDLLLGGLVASGSGSVAPAPPHAVDKLLADDCRERAPLVKLLDAFDLRVKDLLVRKRRPEPRLREARQRFVVEPAYVERGAERASFTLRFPLKHRLRLYLVDPDGQVKDLAGADTRLVSREGNEFAVVKDPQPGLWWLIGVRAASGPAFTYHAFAGVSHRRLVVNGGTSIDNAPAAGVAVAAAAVWGDRLSGLRVEATVIGPDGVETKIMLDDTSPDEPGGSGDYRGIFVPPSCGRYSGTIRILGGARSYPAQMLHRLNHAQIGPGSKTRDIRVKGIASRFVRVIPFSFWSGERPKVTDTERRR